jgi:uncharacterized membrane protein
MYAKILISYQAKRAAILWCLIDLFISFIPDNLYSIFGEILYQKESFVSTRKEDGLGL